MVAIFFCYFVVALWEYVCWSCWGISLTGDRYGGGDPTMEIQHDTVFVTGLAPEVSEQDIGEHFGSIGIIKVSYFLDILKYNINCN